MNESLNRWLARFTQTVHSFRNESNDCLYEWVSESLTHSIHSNSSFFQKRIKRLSLWMSHWIIVSSDSLKQFILSETNQLTAFMNESLNRWPHSIHSTVHSFRNESNGRLIYFTFTFMHLADAFIQSDLHCIQVYSFTFDQLLLSLGIEPMILALLAPCSNHWATGKHLYEWVSESLTRSIHSNSSFFQKRIKWLPLWMSLWIVDSLDSLKQFILSETNQWLPLWMSLWIIDSLDSLKQFILSETNQMTAFMNESLNHWLTRFTQNSSFIQKQIKWLSLWMSHWIIDSLDSLKQSFFQKRIKRLSLWWVSESLTHSIHSNSSFFQKRIKWLSLWMSLWIIDWIFRNEVNAWCSSGLFVSVGFTRWPVTEEVYRVHTCRTTTLTALLTDYISRLEALQRPSGQCAAGNHGNMTDSHVTIVTGEQSDSNHFIYWVHPQFKNVNSYLERKCGQNTELLMHLN